MCPHIQNIQSILPLTIYIAITCFSIVCMDIGVSIYLCFSYCTNQLIKLPLSALKVGKVGCIFKGSGQLWQSLQTYRKGVLPKGCSDLNVTHRLGKYAPGILVGKSYYPSIISVTSPKWAKAKAERRWFLWPRMRDGERLGEIILPQSERWLLCGDHRRPPINYY